MIALILAGGLGTRLRSAVNDRPKVLAEVAGRPFLAYLLDQLDDAGCERAIICTGYRGEQVEHAFGHAYRGMRLVYSREETPLGTAGALRLAAPLIDTDHLLVMNGDSYCAADLAAFTTWHTRRYSRASLLLAQVADTSRFGRVALDSEGRIRAFHEKTPDSGPGWINAGIYLVDRALVSAIPAERAVSLERELFPTWIESGLHGFTADAEFIDIGLPSTYSAAADFFANLDHARLAA